MILIYITQINSIYVIFIKSFYFTDPTQIMVLSVASLGWEIA